MAADPLFDPVAAPTPDEVRSIIGPAAPLWDGLVQRAEAMGARGTFTWEGPKHGWSLKYTRAGRPFVSLTPAPGGFKALVILGRAQVDEAPALPLGMHVRGIFDAARQYPDGRWLFIPVESEQDVADVVALLETKLPPTVRARLAADR
jgi:Protein of unknown function (DUF3788)